MSIFLSWFLTQFLFRPRLSVQFGRLGFCGNISGSGVVEAGVQSIIIIGGSATGQPEPKTQQNLTSAACSPGYLSSLSLASSTKAIVSWPMILFFLFHTFSKVFRNLNPILFLSRINIFAKLIEKTSTNVRWGWVKHQHTAEEWRHQSCSFLNNYAYTSIYNSSHPVKYSLHAGTCLCAGFWHHLQRALSTLRPAARLIALTGVAISPKSPLLAYMAPDM